MYQSDKPQLKNKIETKKSIKLTDCQITMLSKLLAKLIIKDTKIKRNITSTKMYINKY